MRNIRPPVPARRPSYGEPGSRAESGGDTQHITTSDGHQVWRNLPVPNETGFWSKFSRNSPNRAGKVRTFPGHDRHNKGLTNSGQPQPHEASAPFYAQLGGCAGASVPVRDSALQPIPVESCASVEARELPTRPAQYLDSLSSSCKGLLLK